ncbi:MAG TPA: sialate O-acetylesterase [Steroidobacteraceae bacterium]|nr:sialate O-acetylesterase [Steroidobacteraceae bacterium]
MTNKLLVLFAASTAVLFTARSWADVRLPRLVGDHMVLQRDAKLSVWGWAAPGEKIQIQVRSQHVTTRADARGQWSASMGPFTAGGPYDMTVSGKNTVVLHDVLVGDVWLASGQSNMEFPLQGSGEWKTGVYHAETEVSAANYPRVRLFKVHQKVAFRPAKDVDADGWVAVTPETVGNFSAVAYLFGRELHERYRIPVGMIETDWGGTVAEAWVSEAGLKAFPEFREPIDSVFRANEKAVAADAISKLISDPNRPTVLFNSMIDPLIHFRIKGVIWYQGEANAMDNRSAQYRRLFPALIEDWRSHWGYEVPFFFVQLAGYGHNEVEPAEYPWADLREAQSMTLSLPATGMATAIDIGDENDIHPKDKQDVAHRLVLAAANGVYGDNVVYSGPTYQSMQIEGSRIRIKFSNIGSGLLIEDKYGYGRGFEIAAGDGKFRWAQAQKEGHDIVVCNDAISQPVAVRYDWSNTPDGNVYNKEGLPALPFRTDAPKH